MLCFLCIVVSDACCVVFLCKVVYDTCCVVFVCVELCPTHVVLWFLCIVVSDTCCVVFLLCFSSSYVANFSVLSIFDCIFGVLESFFFQHRNSWYFFCAR